MSNKVCKTGKCKSGNRLNNWFGDVESVFQNFFEAPQNSSFHPHWDVVELEKEFQVAVELPGVASEDINVEVKDGVLTLSGEKKFERDENSTWHRTERRFGSFQRTLEFSIPVDLDNVKATFENGVLIVGVPKSEKALPRKVDIQVG